jgi:predicted RNA-binding Zn ribbon-like protein
MEEKKPFQLVAGNAALDFVNTLDNRYAPGGSIELLGSYEDVLRFASQAGLIRAAGADQLKRGLAANEAGRLLQEARKLREAMAGVFYSVWEGRPALVADLNLLSEAAGAALARRRLVWADGGVEWAWCEMEAATPLWMLAETATSLLTSEEMALLRACDSPTCLWLFVDTSKNHSRRWCYEGTRASRSGDFTGAKERGRSGKISSRFGCF